MKKIFKNLMLSVCVLSLGLLCFVGCGTKDSISNTNILSVLRGLEIQLSGGEKDYGVTPVDLIAEKVNNVEDKNYSSYGIPDTQFDVIVDSGDGETSRESLAEGVGAQLVGDSAYNRFGGLRGICTRLTSATNVKKILGKVYTYGTQDNCKICVASASDEKITIYIDEGNGYWQYELYCNETLDGVTRAVMKSASENRTDYMDIKFNSAGKVTSVFMCSFNKELTEEQVDFVAEANFALGHVLKTDAQDDSLKEKTLYVKCFADEDISETKAKIVNKFKSDDTISLEY